MAWFNQESLIMKKSFLGLFLSFFYIVSLNGMEFSWIPQALAENPPISTLPAIRAQQIPTSPFLQTMHTLYASNDTKPGMRAVSRNSEEKTFLGIAAPVPDQLVENYIKLQKEGELHVLEQEFSKVDAEINEHCRLSFQRFKLERRKSLLGKLLNSDFTKNLGVMRHGSLEEAEKLLQSLENPPVAQFDDSYMAFKKEELQLARQILHNRADYKKQVKQEKCVTDALKVSNKRVPLVESPGIAPELNYYYDSIITFPPDSIFNEKIGMPSASNFSSFVEQVHHALDELEKSGSYTAKTILFAKEFAEGTVQHVLNVAQHPVEYGQDFVAANIELLKMVGSLFYDVYSMPDDSFVTHQELQQYENRIDARAEAIMKMYNQLCETIPEMNRSEWAQLSSRIFSDVMLFHGIGKGWGAVKNLCISPKIKQSKLLSDIHSRVENMFVSHPEMLTVEGVLFKAPPAFEETSVLKNAADKIKDSSGKAEQLINQTSEAILKNGYYEVNGFKFTEYYYKRLWSRGRQAPSLAAKAILDNIVEILPDPKGYPGFYKYISDGWYMIYNPTTKIVSHIEPIK